MNLRCSTAPTAEPVLWLDMKQHLRLDNDDDQTYVESLIKLAREYAQIATGRALITQTWELRLDNFSSDPPVLSSGVIRLPWPPVGTISSVKYYDTGGTLQTLDSAYYSLHQYEHPAILDEAYGYSWPATQDVRDAVTVTYTAGYGASGSSVPESIKHGMKYLVGHWYAFREPVVDRTVTNVPMSADALFGMSHHGWHW